MLNKQEVLFEDKNSLFGWRETRVSAYKRNKKLQIAMNVYNQLLNDIK